MAPAFPPKKRFVRSAWRQTRHPEGAFSLCAFEILKGIYRTANRHFLSREFKRMTPSVTPSGASDTPLNLSKGQKLLHHIHSAGGSWWRVGPGGVAVRLGLPSFGLFVSRRSTNGAGWASVKRPSPTVPLHFYRGSKVLASWRFTTRALSAGARPLTN